MDQTRMKGHGTERVWSMQLVHGGFSALRAAHCRFSCWSWMGQSVKRIPAAVSLAGHRQTIRRREYAVLYRIRHTPTGNEAPLGVQRRQSNRASEGCCGYEGSHCSDCAPRRGARVSGTWAHVRTPGKSLIFPVGVGRMGRGKHWNFYLRRTASAARRRYDAILRIRTGRLAFADQARYC